MKIYIQDHSWAGTVVVIAENETEARFIMLSHYPNYNPKLPVEVKEIVKGLVTYNMGDS